MESSGSPIDIARQTLKQLATSKVPPTPDNFRKVYDEIAGVPSQDAAAELAEIEFGQPTVAPAVTGTTAPARSSAAAAFTGPRTVAT